MPQKVYEGGVLAVLLCGCESWCLTAESVRRLSNWHFTPQHWLLCHMGLY